MEYYRKVGQSNVQLYAVSVDPPEVSEALRRRLHIDFTFLSDPDGIVLDALNIRHRKARMQDGGDIAFPTQVLVDRDGIVRWTYTSESYRVRARPEDVFAEIARLDG
jgi:peroxiredoxin